VLSGTGKEGKSLLFALLRLAAPALVVKAEALTFGGRGLNGNNESWHRAKDAAIVVTEEVDGVLDGNAYKELSGGNGVTISGSRKYGHEIATKFSGLVVLLTNNRLNFKPLDGALAGRMLAMQMPSKFVCSAAEAKAAHGEKAHVKVYAAFADDAYVQRLFEEDARYRAALVACLYAHYRSRRGQYAPLDQLYDITGCYVAECAANTPSGMFDSFWSVAPDSARGWTAKQMFEVMQQHVPQDKLQWSNAISLGKFLKSRFAGGPGTWPQQRQAEHANQWFGFELKDDHPTRG